MKFDDLPHANAALAIFPSRDGFGWILFDGPLSPVDYGVCTLARSTKGSERKNARCLARVEALLKEFRPGTLVLEAFEGPGTRRSKRVQNLCRSIISAGAMGGVKVRIISRTQISACFTSQPANTRYEVAMVVKLFLPDIKRHVPRKRKTWEGEFSNMALVAAAALLIVHYANPAELL